MSRTVHRAALGAALLGTACLATGCAVAGATAGAAIAVTGAVVSTGVKLTGKVIGAGIDAVSGTPEEDDGSGIVIRERIRPAPGSAPRCAPAAGDATAADANGSCQ